MIVTQAPPYRPPLRSGAGPEAFKTYQLLQPTGTHTRAVTCQQVDCVRMRNGWRARMDLTTVAGVRDANWIRMKSGRAFTFTQHGPIVTFNFPAGQRCFEKHRALLGRDPLLRVAGGDWRGNPRGTQTQVMSPSSWIDSFGEHQARLHDAQQRG